MNFVAIVVVLGVVYWSCQTQRPAPVGTGATTMPANKSSPATASPRRDLVSFDQVAACLDAHGGVVAATCVIPATVSGVEIGARPNDRYFAATKAPVPIVWRTGADAVGNLKYECEEQPQPQQQARPNSHAELFSCVIDRLQQRTTVTTR